MVEGYCLGLAFYPSTMPCMVPLPIFDGEERMNTPSLIRLILLLIIVCALIWYLLYR